MVVMIIGGAVIVAILVMALRAWVLSDNQARENGELLSMERTFLSYCEYNNLDGVTDCLSRGVDVNTRPFGHRQWTALMIACYRGNSAIVSKLIQVPGLDINYQAQNGETAVLLALRQTKQDCGRLLAETGGVAWNKADYDGFTPLFEALHYGHSDVVEIILQQADIDLNVQTVFGGTLPIAAVTGGDLSCLEALGAEGRCRSWNVRNRAGNTPVMMALKKDREDLLKVLLRCPGVDFNCRDKEGWSLVFRAIQRNKLDLLRMILSKLKKPYSSYSLTRIAVEVGEEEDIRLLVHSQTQVSIGDGTILCWALKNEHFSIADILMPTNKINLQGDPSADLTINCGSETFRVHKYFLCSKSPVFSAMLNCDMREAREGEINIRSMNSNTLSSMIHYIYTGEMADGLQDLDIEDVTIAADMYDLPGWVELHNK